MGQTIILGRS